MKTLTSHCVGFGHYVPANKIANDQLEHQFALAPGWIVQRTGIKERRWASDHESVVDLAEKACLAALNHSGLSRKEIGFIILATSTPDHLLPPTAPMLCHRLGMTEVGSYDLSSACSGFLHALAMADGFVRTQEKAVLVVAANILSRRINHSEHYSAILFGDAAGAVVLAPSTDTTKGIFGMNFLSDGSLYDLIGISAGGSVRPFSPDIPLCDYKMNLRHGGIVFNKAIKLMSQCAESAMRSVPLSAESIDYFIPHQANFRIIESTAKRLNIPLEKTISIVDDYGNTSSAGMPLALSLSHQNKPFTAGEKIVLTSAGAGMTAGAMILCL